MADSSLHCGLAAASLNLSIRSVQYPARRYAEIYCIIISIVSGVWNQRRKLLKIGLPYRNVLSIHRPLVAGGALELLH